MKKFFMILCGIMLIIPVFSQTVDSKSEEDFIAKLGVYEQLLTNDVLSAEDLFVFWKFNYPWRLFLEGDFKYYPVNTYSDSTQLRFENLYEKNKVKYDELISAVASLSAPEQFILMIEKYDKDHIMNNSNEEERQANIATYYRVFEYVFFELFCDYDIEWNYRTIRDALTDDQKSRIVNIYKKYDSQTYDNSNLFEKYDTETLNNFNMFYYIYIVDNITSKLEKFYNDKIVNARSKKDINETDLQYGISLTDHIEKMTRDKIYRMLVTDKQTRRLQNQKKLLEEWVRKYYINE